MKRRLSFCFIIMSFVISVASAVHANFSGFLYDRGTFTSIDYGADMTEAFGINNSGSIVGIYEGNVPGTGPYGFLDVGGNFSSIVVPGAYNTIAFGINDSGSISGSYSEYVTGGQSFTHGFLYAGGTFTPIDYPGTRDTEGTGINNSGSVVGEYNDLGRMRGFLYDRGTHSLPLITLAPVTQSPLGSTIPVPSRESIMTKPMASTVFSMIGAHSLPLITLAP